jgi:hypothetical protein
MSIDLVLALTLFLAATWIALLNTIISTTRETPAEHSLMIVAFMHFVVLAYFVLAAAVLYGRTVKAVTGRVWVRMSTYEEILVLTWPAALVSALLGYLTTKLTGFVNPFIMAIPFFGIAIWLLVWGKRTKHLGFLVAVTALFFPYLIAMSLIWCGVSVNMDKSFYKSGETAIITVRSQGYLFNPYINQVQLMAGSYPTHRVAENLLTSYVRVVEPITGDMPAGNFSTNCTLIEVSYTPQASWFKRTEYVEITIIP